MEFKEHLNNWLKDNYGSIRAILSLTYFKILNMFGFFRKYKKNNFRSVNRVVFICKGNICRSAYAEAVAKSIGINAISCGIYAVDSKPADENAILVANKLGINLHHHRTTPISKIDLKQNDLLLVMEPWQADAVASITNHSYDISLLGLWMKPELPYIHDPYGSSSDYFEKCFNQIEQSVHGLAKKMGK